jgi:uncharacterized protein (TIGR02246 family)
MCRKAGYLTLFFAASMLNAAADAQTPARKPAAKPAAKAPAAATAKPAAVAPAVDPAEAVKATAEAFTAAFNKHDAKAVAALWTEDGEYVDETGERFAGRDAIEKQYAAFFAAYPATKLTVVVDSVRAVGANAALEDGHTTLEADGKTVVSAARYTAVHAKVGDQWLMASVRDQHLETEPSTSQMQDLAWLVGSWSAEQNGGVMQVDCKWLAENHFLERKYSVKRGEEVVASGVQVIGWNAQLRSVQAWTFTSDGGHATGIWIPRRGGWVIENVGMLADGTPTTAVNFFVKVDDNTLNWKAVERSAGGVFLPDTEDVTLKRTTAQ